MKYNQIELVKSKNNLKFTTLYLVKISFRNAGKINMFKGRESFILTDYSLIEIPMAVYFREKKSDRREKV